MHRWIRKEVLQILYDCQIVNQWLQKVLNKQIIQPQNSQQKSVPDLHGVTVAFLALKKNGFSEKKILPKKKLFFFTFFQCNFSVRTLWCFQKKFKIFF